MANQYLVYLNANDCVVSKEYADYNWVIENPEYDTILKFFHTDLVVGFIGHFNSGNRGVVYHPGAATDIIKGSIAVGQVAWSIVGAYKQSNKLANLSQAEEAEYNAELARARINAQRMGRSVPNNLFSFVQHFKDAQKFSEQGYYSDIFGSNPRLEVRGQMKHSNLYRIT